MAEWRKWGSTLKGMNLARSEFKRLPLVTAEIMNEATADTASELAAKAKARVRVRYGFLQGAIDYSLQPKTGGAMVGLRRGTWRGALGVMLGQKGATKQSARITLGKNGGVQGSRLHYPSRYGHLVEFGHGGPHPAPAHPFLLPSAEEERGPYRDRCRAGGRKLESEMGKNAHTGGGLL